MKKKTVSGMMLALLLISMLMLAFNIQLVKGGNITVPDDYPTVQEAVTSAYDGDTIYVRNGIYPENVQIGKPVAIIGKSRSGTIIDGSLGATNIHHLTISNLTVRNSYGDGIRFFNVSRSTLTNLTVTDCTNNGLWIGYSDSNLIANNLLTNNGITGMALVSSSNNTLRNNSMFDNEKNQPWGNFGYSGREVEHFINDIDTSNLVDGKHVYTFSNLYNTTISPETVPNVGHLVVVNCSGMIVKDLVVEAKTSHGVDFPYTSNSVIQNVTVSTREGITLRCWSRNNTINNCSIVNCIIGIHVFYDSSDNSILSNTVTHATESGIAFSGSSSSNLIVGNTIEQCNEGVYLGQTNNTFYHNNFIDNTQQVFIYEFSESVWGNDYPSGGNYWSNYAGTDSDGDGIGDTPYVIDENNQDNYPLMNPYIAGDVDYDGMVNASDLSMLGDSYGAGPDESDWNIRADTNNDFIVDVMDLFTLGKNYGMIAET